MKNLTGIATTLGIAALAIMLAGGQAGCDRSDNKNAENKGQQQPNQPATSPVTPLVPVVQVADWCREHEMPESICVQCNPSLAAGYKAKGDWDAEHNLPKSQCFKCDPGLKQKFAAAYKEKYGKEPPAQASEDNK